MSTWTSWPGKSQRTASTSKPHWPYHFWTPSTVRRWWVGTLLRCCSRARGSCAGVEMAIKALAWMARALEPPVYCYHEIVHNQKVVKRCLPTLATVERP